MQGSCLCGAVVYEVEAPGLLIGHCSCRTCRKAHAAPFTTTARVPRGGFSWRTGADKLRSFESSPGRRRHFCSICGTHLIAERPADPHVVLRVATLDEDPGTRPIVHIWRSHEVPWLDYGGDIKRFDERPPSR